MPSMSAASCSDFVVARIRRICCSSIFSMLTGSPMLGASREHVRGKTLDADMVGLAQDSGPFDDVAQLPDVAGPAVTPERFKRLFREAAERAVVAPSKEYQKLLRERNCIIRPFAEWRNLDLDHVEPIEEVFAEPSFLDRILQIHVRRRDETHIGSARRVVADPFVLPVLDEPQQLRLQGERQVADLVQEERAAVARRDAARVVANRAGERSPDMPEEFAFEQLQREGRTGDDAERLIRAVAPGMDGSCENGLPRPALPAEQDRGVGGRDLARHFNGPPHRRVRTRKIDFGMRSSEVFLQSRDSLLEVRISNTF